MPTNYGTTRERDDEADMTPIWPTARALSSYERHQDLEGRDAWNAHPEGCYWCGSTRHHSQDCAEREF